MFRLDEKIALITGGGSGIGAAMATLFARQGAQVCIVELNEEGARQVVTSIQQEGGKADAFTGDVAEEEQVQRVMDEIVTRYGRLDILVNNAGISHVGNVLETSLDDWERTLRVNARGVFLCTREGVRQMVKQTPSGGSIINLSSVAAQVGLERRLAYSSSKGAVLALTRSVAIDFVGQGIRCNALCPGTIQTPFVEGYLARSFPGHEDEVRQTLHARQPLGRMGTPEEIATAALYLASDEASFTTGAAFSIDGGLTAR